jgi:hypothetical protein
MKIRFGWGPASFAVSLLALTLSLGGTGYALTVASQSPARQAVQAASPVWHNLTLLNGWHYGGSGAYHAAFYKDSGGVVHLRGSVAGSTELVFQLPRGDRPAHTLFILVYAINDTLGALEVDSNGQAKLFDNNSGSNVGTYSSLDGVSFPVP